MFCQTWRPRAIERLANFGLRPILFSYEICIRYYLQFLVRMQSGRLDIVFSAGFQPGADCNAVNQVPSARPIWVEPTVLFAIGRFCQWTKVHCYKMKQCYASALNIAIW